MDTEFARSTVNSGGGTSVNSRSARIRKWLFAVDVFAAVVGWVVLVLMIRLRTVGHSPAMDAAAIGFALTACLLLVIVFANGQYSGRRRISRLRDIVGLLRALIVSAAIVALLSYLTKGFFTDYTTPSRVALGIGVVAFLAVAVVGRLFLSAIQETMFAHGESLTKLMVVGTGRTADDFLEYLEARPWLGIRCVGRISYEDHGHGSAGEPARDSDTDIHLELLNSIEGLEALHGVMVSTGANEVVVAIDPGEHDMVYEISRLLTIAHIPFKLVPSLFEQGFHSAELLGLGELPVVDVSVDPLDQAQRMVKRAVDVTVSCIALLCLCIVILPLMLAIKLDSRGPIFYKQERVGKNGRRFKMCKFRSMVVNAERQLDDLRDQDESGSGGQMFKIKNDPRITRMGRILRKTSLDEMPQFWNVLRGDMSVVGPRPPLPAEVENYEDNHTVRLRVLPGITGLWQVSGRSSLTFEQMVALDSYYMDNWSLWMDFYILFKTFWIVVARRGAF